MKAIAAAVAICLITSSISFAQALADTSPEKAAIIANDKAYEAAYAKADVKALGAFFAEDAEYTSDDGRTISGRAAIEDGLRAALLERKGGKLAISVDSVRVLSPDVVLEKGSTNVTEKDGDTSGALYTAIHVKKDGAWKISQLIESPLPVVTPHERLSELDWLVGEWEDSDKANDLSVRSQFVWSRGGNFITRNVTIKRADDVVLEGWQIIGWDSVGEQIRSWTFDGEGGFSEGRWTHEGNRWLQRESGYSPEGGRTTADNTFTKVSADRFTWESNNRTLNGDPQPSINRVEINRVKGN